MSKKRNHNRQLAKYSGGIFGNPQAAGGKGNSGGWGVGSGKSKPAGGHAPTVNPFMQPKSSGLNIITQSFPSNYFVEWNMTTWRVACDQAMKQGYCLGYATLTSWTFEKSLFIQSLFEAWGSFIDKIPFFVNDSKGNQIPELTDLLCNKPYQMELRKEIIWAYFWGFTGLNIDPIGEKVYKYNMQDIDPINRMLRSSTFAFFDGIAFDDSPNLLFVQPSASYERFLGFMQPLTASFIQINLSKNNWLGAGTRLAFPIMNIGYAQNDSAIDPLTNLETNPSKLQALDIAANIDPTKANVYPFVIDDEGNVVKSVDIGFEKPQTGASQHLVFKDFNADEKEEAEQLILGGPISGKGGKGGNRSLGEIQERNLQRIMAGKLEFLVAYLNSEVKPKISKFYKDLPEDWSFAYNKSKQLSIEEIVDLSNVLTQAGKRFTEAFFEANGLSADFIEDNPLAVAQAKPIEADLNIAGLKKKF